MSHESLPLELARARAAIEDGRSTTDIPTDAEVKVLEWYGCTSREQYLVKALRWARRRMSLMRDHSLAAELREEKLEALRERAGIAARITLGAATQYDQTREWSRSVCCDCTHCGQDGSWAYQSKNSVANCRLVGIDITPYMKACPLFERMSDAQASYW